MNYKEYTDLAPKDDIENGKEYINALGWALNNPRIKNIALAGPYGAGKSSIIDTFLKLDNEQHKFCGIKGCFHKKKNISKTSLKISMATFQCEAENKIDIDANEVEEGILKQLFYKVKYNKIPQSRYRKLYVKNYKLTFLAMLLISLTLAITATIFLPEISSTIWSRMEAFVERYDLPKLFSVIFLVILWTLSLSIITRLWCNFSNRYHLKEITLPTKSKLAADTSLSDSVFNKNLDEIMYFFEATKYRVIFFEDLDRLDDRKIFVHLRELNNLLNNDESIKEKPVVFVYAIKDDIFTKEDRTKFFDFIIPVIPVINSTNSGDVMLDKLNKSQKQGISHNISQEFILDISPFISDMRMLENIYNEFVIYKNTLQVSQELSLSDEQMMAIIIFKNLYPTDFANIQAETGIIKEAFVQKENYIQAQKNRLQDKINNFSNVISNAETDFLKSVRELKYAMLVAITEDFGITVQLEENYRNRISSSSIMSETFDMHRLTEIKSCTVQYINSNGYSSHKSIDNFSEKIASYVNRWEYLNIFEKEGLEKLQNQLETLKQEQHSLSSKSIASLLSDDNGFCFKGEIPTNKVLIFLLRRGYIDEKYATYINYFKGNSITTADMNFILSVKNRELKPFDYTLTRTSRVVQRLQEYEFEQKSIYNFDLMEELLSNDHEERKRQLLLQQLSDESEISWRFIDEFIDKTKFKSKFISLLSSTWPEIWDYISELSLLSYDRQLYYLSLLINTLDEDAIENLNSNNAVKSYIESHADILQKLSVLTSNDSLCSVLARLKVSFAIQEISNVPSCVLDFVFDHCLYQLNEKMIFNVVSYKNQTLAKRLRSQPYTVILDLGYTPLIDYVDCNFEDYLKNNLLTKDSLTDHMDVIISMLTKILSNRQFCISVIQIEDFCATDISQFLENSIESQKEDVRVIWDTLLSSDKIDPTWENVISYWKHFSFSEVLGKYVTVHTEILQSANTSSCTDDYIRDLIVANLGNHVYACLLPILHMHDFNLDLRELNEDILTLMIEIKYFDFTPTRFIYLYTTHQVLAIGYIERNQKEFLDQIDDITMSSQLLNQLLSSNSITDATKESLFTLFSEEYMCEDIVSYIVDNNITLNKTCFSAAWQYADLEQKDRLFMDNFELFDADELEKYFGVLGEKYTGFINRSYRHDAELPESEENLKLAKHLLKTQYITSYEIILRERYDSKLLRTYKYKAIKYRIKQKR